ncbi:MAG: 3-dehydroquinate synthase, partial [Rhodospirillaceae bacterium]|nr:3-dehydroquinate synthase [Rhodospirillaceae bacterium]
VVRVARHLEGIGLPTSVKNIAEPHWTPELIIGHMSKDKKTESGQLTFVLARAIGEAFTTRDVPADLLNALVADMMAR